MVGSEAKEAVGPKEVTFLLPKTFEEADTGLLSCKTHLRYQLVSKIKEESGLCTHPVCRAS